MLRVLAIASLLVASTVHAAKDAAGCSDPAVLPSRIPGYVIDSCETTEFSTQEFNVEGKAPQVVEGKKTVMRYVLPEGAKGASETFIQRNYLNALVKLGGKKLAVGPTTVVLKKADQETWIGVSGYVGEGSPEQMGAYVVTIVEQGTMNQVITAADIFGELKRAGRVALYIQFDTGTATIKAESEPLIKEMARLLTDNKALKVYVVGHTDAQGSLEPNLKLSRDRADAVAKALASKHGVAVNRMTAQGVGPLSPLATNDSEDGRKQNRRVELVKQ